MFSEVALAIVTVHTYAGELEIQDSWEGARFGGPAEPTNPDTEANGADGKRTNGARQELYGEEAAREALRKSVRQLPMNRVRNIEQRIVEGSPAKALLEVAGDNPKNLIVVGNRGLGAEEGEFLGEVPREVVKCAPCNVMVVQTGGEEDQISIREGQSTSDQDGRTRL